MRVYGFWMWGVGDYASSVGGLRFRGLGCWVVAQIPKKPGLQPNLNLGLHLALRPGTLVSFFGLRKVNAQDPCWHPGS